MNELALRAKTDKASDGHNYTKVYEQYLEPLRFLPLLIFELGVGGYQYPDRGGESLQLWHDYFPNARIVGVDYYEKTGLERERVDIVKGSQDDPALVAQLVEKFGQPDLIIDDASHICDLTIKSFEIFFPILKPGGLYFCEDVHTSFWTDYHGNPDPIEVATFWTGSKKISHPTTLQYFQALTAQLSHDTLLAEYRNQYAGYLEFIHFFRNLVIIKKSA
jgi:hypothetical protein